MKPFIRLLVFGLALGITVTARADLTFTITQGADNATPIAVVPFKGPQADQNIGTIISNDLQRSGLFNPISSSHFPSLPSSAGEVLFSEWKPTGANYLVVGSVAPTADNRFEFHYALFNVVSGSRMLDGTMTYGADKWRDVAHFISDQVFKQITGIRGAFSTRIVYVNEYRGANGKLAYRLVMSDSDGYRPKYIVPHSSEPILSPTWSHDGNRVAYVSFESGKPAIYVQTIATGARTKVADFVGLNGAPSFSPDGQRLALTLSRDGNPEIYIMDLATRVLKRITYNSAIDTEARWAPDGNSLIFTSDRGGTPQVYRYTLASGETTRLTYSGNFNARADLSPDGRYLSMVHRDHGQQFDIAIMDLKSGTMTTLTKTPLDESPSFSPNGVMLLYATRSHGKGVLGFTSVDGSFQATSPESSGEVREPAWSPFLH